MPFILKPDCLPWRGKPLGLNRIVLKGSCHKTLTKKMVPCQVLKGRITGSSRVFNGMYRQLK